MELDRENLNISEDKDIVFYFANREIPYFFPLILYYV